MSDKISHVFSFSFVDMVYIYYVKEQSLLCESSVDISKFESTSPDSGH